MEARVEASRDDGRFEVRDVLGAGGMGVVYRAFDRRDGRLIALKRLRQASGRDLYRFKREFRALADLVHPSLVPLHELHTAGDEWFLTMELVEGVSFIDWVRPPRQPVGRGPEGVPMPRPRQSVVEASVDLARLEASLPQLVDGVLALHVSGKLHRDLKPSNVIVRGDGRVVLLDFGLVSDLSGSHADRTHDQAAVGTPAHMSPEQAADQPLSEASDWYSVGVMLYEALTGRRPFEGNPHDVMRRKQNELPPPPSAFAPKTPPALDELCMRLLAQSAADRPDGRAILAALGAAPSRATLDLERSLASAPFVGRTAELSALHDALIDAGARSVAVFVRGESGMGKSQLLRRFLDALGRDALVLEGRCYERESVPFKTLDAAIDALAALLVRLPEERQEALVPRDVSALARLFPVLRRVPAVAARAVGAWSPPDPQELRRRAFSALRNLLRALARTQPLILAIDDLQWGDADSAVFLSELIHHPEPLPLLLLMVHRLGDDAGIVARVQARPPGLALGDVRTIELGPLDSEDAGRMVRAISDASEDTADTLVREAGGHPLFLIELARSTDGHATGSSSLGELIARRVRALPASAVALLQAAAIAARPMPAAQLASVAGLDGLGSELLRLRAERLLRVRRVGPEESAVVEPYHDRVRAAVIAAIDAPAQRRIHAALAAQLETTGRPGDLEPLVEHCLGAGDGPRAARHAARAAVAAEEALAFHRAGELYRVALEHGDLGGAERRALLRRAGTALANAGRLEDAAAAFADAEHGADPDELLELRRMRLEQLLRRGRLGEGLALSRTVLTSVGLSMPRDRAAALRSAIVDRVRLRLRGLSFTPRDEASIPRDVLRRVDVLFSTAAGLGFVDPILGGALQFQFLRAALDAGEPRRVGMALSQELGYVATAGIRSRGHVERVRARLLDVVTPLGPSYLAGRARAGDGQVGFLTGQWKEARAAFEVGTRMMRDHATIGRFEIDIAELFYLASLYYLGETREMVRLAQLLLRDAVERGDVYAQHGLRGGRINVAWLIMGKPEDARAHALGIAAEMTPAEGFHLQHYFEFLAHTQIDLYVGDAEGAWQRIQAVMPVLEHSHLTRVQAVRIESRFLRARAALAYAQVSAARRPELLAEARKLARRLDRERVGWAHGLAEQTRATIAQLAGDDDVLDRLERARELYAWADMAMHASAMTLRRGQLEGGAMGGGVVRSVRETMREQAIADPDAMVRMLTGVDP
jgi:eukaryotic-like serine/threonine-protein kinase